MDNKQGTGTEPTVIRVGILAEEPLGWGSGKHFFPAILDGYSWTSGKTSYRFSTRYLFDTDILKGELAVSKYDVLVVPGGGVGDGEAIVKGFHSSWKARRWKKRIVTFIKDGGGYVGICGGAALLTGLSTGDNRTPTTFMERQYHKSSLGISCVTSYYNHLALPIFYLFQKNHPEHVGATGYLFSFAPGETIDGKRIYAAGAPIDFHILRDHPIFSDVPEEAERIRWWGGPALVIPGDPDREVTVLARYPKKELSEDPSTRIRAWRYTGGFRGLLKAFFKASRLVKEVNDRLKHVFLYAYFLAGDWECTDKVIDLDYSNKPCITAEVYPNENNGRILLCAAHPEYMVWRDGHIEEVEASGFHCLATGLHRWENIASLSTTVEDELTATWWMVRRFVAWAAKVPDKHLPPITKGHITSKERALLSSIFYDGSIISQMKNI